MGNGQAGFAHGDEQDTSRLAQLGRGGGVLAEERSLDRALVWSVFADDPRHLIEYENQPILKRIFLRANTTAVNIAYFALAIFDEAVARARTAGIYSKNKQSEDPLGLSHEFFEFVFSEIKTGKNLLYVV